MNGVGASVHFESSGQQEDRTGTATDVRFITKLAMGSRTGRVVGGEGGLQRCEFVFEADQAPGPDMEPNAATIDGYFENGRVFWSESVGSKTWSLRVEIK